MGLFGSISRSLFGGSKNKSSSQSESGNKAYDTVLGLTTPLAERGSNMFNRMADELGSFEDYKKNAGFDFLYNKGMRDRVGGAAAKGILNSGMTGKALAKYETDLGSTFYNNWLDRLGSLTSTGLGALNPLIAAGQWSKGTATGKGTSGNGILSSLFG